MSNLFSPLILPTEDNRGLQSSLLTVIDALNVITPRLGAVEDILAASGLATTRFGTIPMTWLGPYTAAFVYLHGDVVTHNRLLMIANKTTTETPSLSAVDWDLLASFGEIPVQGDLAVTEATDVLAATSKVLVQGDLVVTEAADVLAATGELVSLTPEVEVINVADFVGLNDFEVTTINGTPIGDFHSISVVGTAVKTSGTGANVTFGAQLSINGGTSYLGTGHYHGTKEARAVRGSATFDHMRFFDTALPGAGYDFMAEFKCLDQACPTYMTSHELSQIGSPLHLGSITNTSYAVHNAIKIGVHEDVPGTVTLLSGQIVLVGYRGHAETEVQEVVISGGEGEFFVNISAGHTVVDIMTSNLAMSGSNLAVQTSVAGTEDAGVSDYRRYNFGFVTTNVGDFTQFEGFTGTASTRKGFTELWGLNTAGAQIINNGYQLDGNGLIIGGMRQATTVRSQIRLFVSNGTDTFTSGSIWIVSRKIPAVVHTAEDFAVPTSDVPMVDLALFPGLVVSASTVTLASNLGMFFETSDDNGATWHSSAQRQMEVFGGGDTVFTNDTEQDFSMREDLASYILWGRFSGFGTDSHLVKNWTFNGGTIATNNKNGAGYRETKEIINALQLTSRTADMDGGDFLAVAYKL